MSNEFYVEKLLCNDAAKIDIDEEFKCDLKNRILLGGKYNNITELHKHKNNFKQSKYFKIASGFVICVFVSGTIFKVMDVPSKSMFAKGEGKSNADKQISSVKKSTVDNREKAIVSKTNEVVTNKGNVNTIPIVKDSQGNAVKIIKDTAKDANISEKIDNGVEKANASTDVIAPINVPSVPNVPDVTNVATVTNVPDVPKMENVKDVVSSSLKLYDSSYSLGEKSLVNVKEGAIYVKDVESSTEKKLIAYNEKTQIVEKPNFTPTNEVIYYKAEKVTTENGDIGAKNGAIYLADKNGQGSIKLVDGKNPMISKDGKNLVYETDGKIVILNLATNIKKVVDNGKEPAFANNGNTISYVKEEKETQTYDSGTTKKDAYIQKTFSSLWVFDLATGNTHSLTNNEVNINSESIQSWADAVKTGSITSDLKVTSKYSYFESIWSSNSKEIYVIRKNNDTKIFELIKFNLDN